MITEQLLTASPHTSPYSLLCGERMGDGQSPSLQSRTEWPEAAEDSTRRVSQGSVELKMPEMNEVSLPGQAGLCWSQGCGGLQHGVSFYFFLRKLKHVYTR